LALPKDTETHLISFIQNKNLRREAKVLVDLLVLSISRKSKSLARILKMPNGSRDDFLWEEMKTL
jgi:hypothetical protein